MRILRYTYSKILNLFLRRFDSLISIGIDDLRNKNTHQHYPD